MLLSVGRPLWERVGHHSALRVVELIERRDLDVAQLEERKRGGVA